MGSRYRDTMYKYVDEDEKETGNTSGNSRYVSVPWASGYS